MENTRLQKKEKILKDQYLVLILLYDLLIGQGLKGGDKFQVNYIVMCKVSILIL